MNAQLKKGALELCVLAQLAPKDRYGYELTDTISFKEEAYLETYLVESPDGPARKYYHLTPSGHEYLKKSLREWKEFVLAVERLTEN